MRGSLLAGPALLNSMGYDYPGLDVLHAPGRSFWAQSVRLTISPTTIRRFTVYEPTLPTDSVEMRLATLVAMIQARGTPLVVRWHFEATGATSVNLEPFFKKVLIRHLISQHPISGETNLQRGLAALPARQRGHPQGHGEHSL